MRVIKFGVWEPKNKTFKYDPFSIWTRYSLDEEGLREIKGPLGYEWTEDTDSILEQFTGLHDKNGVEIYEGDIVYIAGTGNCAAGISPILGVFFKDVGGACELDAHDVLMEDDMWLVVGNIHQNPELLT